MMLTIIRAEIRRLETGWATADLSSRTAKASSSRVASYRTRSPLLNSSARAWRSSRSYPAPSSRSRALAPTRTWLRSTEMVPLESRRGGRRRQVLATTLVRQGVGQEAARDTRTKRTSPRRYAGRAARACAPTRSVHTLSKVDSQVEPPVPPLDSNAGAAAIGRGHLLRPAQRPRSETAALARTDRPWPPRRRRTPALPSRGRPRFSVTTSSTRG